MAPVSSPEQRPYPPISRDEVEALIADGRKIVIYQDHALKVDPWLPYHPGGDKAVLHMVGRDATAEIEALHSDTARQQMLRYRIGKIQGLWRNFVPPIQGGTFRTLAEIKDDATPSSDVDSAREEARSRSPASRSPSPVFDVDGQALKRRTGRAANQPAGPPSASRQSAAGPDMDGMSYLDAITREHISLDLEKYPTPDPETQAGILAKYRALHQRVHDKGLYRCDFWAYAVDCCRYIAFFALMFVCLGWGQYALGGIFLGFMWHQLVFAAHDAGHMGITHKYSVDTIIGIIIANFIGGLSMGWWKRNHNVHHILTNAPEHDPDIEHMPLFAVSHRLLGSLRSTYYGRVMKYDAAAKFFLRIQSWTYYPLLALGRFNLYVQSWDYILANRGAKKGPGAWHRWLELTGQVFFWTWFGYGILYKMIPDGWSRFVFIMTSHVASSPLHVQIVLSHFAMSTADLGPHESFPQRMLRTTMDVDCPPWLDFVHGGLQFQIIHHLFPRMPRHNLRKAQKLVQEFCNDVGIPYVLYGFADSNKQVIGRLSEVSRQAAILGKCQKTIAMSGDFFGHDHHDHRSHN
ncbi:fatty acid desaturase domain-containing protein [Hirsutella rhossiliensis]|uniref:Delta 8-(E)-sphingolipid desaturase n=1 Tax=Hirsutella rhossiliensis TaxID=111463 RepID=A0A9P8SDH4_9HYPO|nr:fatty acid desaturase domain-containing protein [Hirsutella rhossiliensis]KAH0957964.1 fatty acid desaturase domain-containing protein [Hirsutella rhossiliensis]